MTLSQVIASPMEMVSAMVSANTASTLNTTVSTIAVNQMLTEKIGTKNNHYFILHCYSSPLQSG